jgi:AsmA-like protein
LKGAGLLIGILLVFWLIVVWYVSANKKEIIFKITEELNERMNATAVIGNLDPSFFQTFPFLSLRLSDISLRDSMWQTHHHDFLKAEKFYIRINPLSLFSASPKINKIIVEKGSIYLFTDTTNYTNAYILNAKKKSTRKGLKPPFSGIDLKQVRLTFINPYAGKLFDFDIRRLQCDVDSEDSATVLAIKTDMMVHDLAFNTDRGIYLRGKPVQGKFEVLLNEQSIELDKVALKINQQRLIVSAKFELGPDPKFRLEIAATKADYTDLAALLTARLQKKLDTFDVSGPINVSATLTGSLLPKTQPLINVAWSVKESDLHTPVGDFTDCSFTGSYTNQADPSLPKEDSNSIISINSFKGNWEKILLKSSKLSITRLREPKIAFDLQTSLDLEALNALTGIESFLFKKGKADVNVNYSGPIMKEDTTQTIILGAVDITGGELTYIPRDLTLTGCKGSLIFDNKDVYIKDLKANTKRSDLLIGGKIRNFLSMMNMASEDMRIDLDLSSTNLDLGDFVTNLQKRNVSGGQKSTARLLRIANKIDKMIAESAMNIELSAKKMQYKKFAGSNVKAEMALEKDDWNLKNISMNHADGSFILDGKLKTTGNDNPFTLRGRMDKIDISKVFHAFNNFSFDGLTEKNIGGILTADFDISASINSKSEIVPYSTRGFINMSLKEGSLKDFEPMQKISNSVFKNRDMTDIRFAELKDNLEINGTAIKINSMEIQSTVITMFIEGIYDMKSGPDMSIIVPLSNLKKRGPDYELVNKGTDSKKGPSVHLRAKYGDDGKVKVSWDPFKKALKNKEKVASIP